MRIWKEYVVEGDTRCKPYSWSCATTSFTKNSIAHVITLGQNRGHPLCENKTAAEESVIG